MVDWRVTDPSLFFVKSSLLPLHPAATDYQTQNLENIGATDDYTYEDLCSRIYTQLQEKNPNLSAGARTVSMKPPQVSNNFFNFFLLFLDFESFGLFSLSPLSNDSVPLLSPCLLLPPECGEV